ncbi:MAG: hypothetical protein MnENMB40S_26220 [Rhizobiaceae bacterium MnEN-MB40S]|nr:MAG: hypothetical protein MnENMB40S_26220 [Rhizobiaceae bacterium MnEN-MB40S]
MQYLSSGRYSSLKGAIFIVCYGRSGSTLLTRLINSIPGACIRGENANALMHLFRAYEAAHRTRYTQGKPEHADTSPWFGADKVAPSEFGDALVDCFVRQILKPEPTATWLGFKEIRYHELGDRLADYLDFLQQFFPNAHFIFNRRSHSDVAKSGWFAQRPAETVEKIVGEMDAAFLDYHENHPGNSRITDYEAFSEDPRCLKPVFDMLGEELDLPRCREILNVRLKH